MTDRPDLLETLGSEEAVTRAAKIAELNDDLRKHMLFPPTVGLNPHRTVVFMGEMSSMIQNMRLTERVLHQGLIARQVQQPAVPFTADNDPYGERDKGRFDWNGESCMWAISYYDLDQKYHSPDEADPAVTHRVLTIFLARDY